MAMQPTAMSPIVRRRAGTALICVPTPGIRSRRASSNWNWSAGPCIGCGRNQAAAGLASNSSTSPACRRSRSRSSVCGRPLSLTRPPVGGRFLRRWTTGITVLGPMVSASTVAATSLTTGGSSGGGSRQSNASPAAGRPSLGPLPAKVGVGVGLPGCAVRRHRPPRRRPQPIHRRRARPPPQWGGRFPRPTVPHPIPCRPGGPHPRWRGRSPGPTGPHPTRCRPGRPRPR